MCGRFTYLTAEEMESVCREIEGRYASGVLVGADRAGEGAAASSRDATASATPGITRAGLPGNPLAGLLGEADRGQARPRSSVHAIVPAGRGFELQTFQWGFMPTRSTDVVFNTRIESALNQTPLWVRPMRDGRCILPVASFFEPHRSEKAMNPRTRRQSKRQYEFADPDGAPLLLASVSDGKSLSILTTVPNEKVAPVHARMPLVLRFEEVPTWLFGDCAQLADRSQVDLLVAPEDDPAQGEGGSQLSLF